MTAANRRGFLSSHKTTTGFHPVLTSLNVGFVARKRIGRAADSVNAGRIAKRKGEWKRANEPCRFIRPSVRPPNDGAGENTLLIGRSAVQVGCRRESGSDPLL